MQLPVTHVQELLFNSSEKEAAEFMGVSVPGLKQRRLKGTIPSFCYTKIGYRTVRYCLPLLKQWQLNPNDAELHARLARQRREAVA